MASDMVTLIVPGLLEQVPVIRHWLQSVLAEWMISAEVIADLALAVTELCTNIITHGYGETAGEIELRLIYRLPGGPLCTSCPRRPPAERAALLEGAAAGG